MKKTLTALTLLALSANPAYAYQLTVSGEPAIGVKDLGGAFKNIADMAIIIGAIMVFFYLLWGGIQWLTSGGDKGKTEEAQKRITAAVIGLAIVASAWAIMRVIDAFFGVGLFSGGNVTLPTINN
jgi:hypothetical protein